MTDDVKEIYCIEFGLYTPDEILKMSVCEITNTKLSGPGSVYDERMGPNMDTNSNCVTCKQSYQECTGHFGYIKLNEPIIHPQYYRQVVGLLKCFCKKCYRLLITKEHLILKNIDKYKGERKYNAILNKLEKIDVCCHCDSPQPNIVYSAKENVISMMYNNSSENKERKKISVVMSVNDIKNIFDNISNEDVSMIGFNPNRIHPRSLVISVFPVIPPSTRPCVITDGNICDDDLTNQIIEIVKANNQLESKEEKEIKRHKIYQSLKFRISTFYNNSAGKAKHPTNKRPLKGLKERISGKSGQVRLNLLGKRCEFSGRTVIGPDPTLKLHQIAIPVEMSKILTTPEIVTVFNKEKLEKIVNEGKANHIKRTTDCTNINLKYALNSSGTTLLYGDKIKRGNIFITVNNSSEKLKLGDELYRDGKKIDVTYPKKRYIKLQLGDKIDRHLVDGDIVLLNRQPTLHKGSMLGKEVVIRPFKTIRMNLATTSGFNADFDGDEMNLHVPQNYESKAELTYLTKTIHNMITPQSSKPIVRIVQDSLTSSYLMTKGINKISRCQFFDICMECYSKGKYGIWNPERIATIKRVFKKFGKPSNPYTGHGIFSMILPHDFYYEYKNDANKDEPYIRIYKGVMYEGTLNKNTLGSSYQSLILLLNKEYGPEIAAEFVDNVQFIARQWLLIFGFSIGLEDCMVANKDTTLNINDNLQKCYIEAKGIEKTTKNPNIKEIRITAALSKAKDIGMKLAKDSMKKNNNLLSTVNSGSKGDFFNISQITGLLGQQLLKGKRVPKQLSHNRRTLPHYPFSNMSDEEEYESRGFISNSFIHGLNPQEFYFHALSAREGICDTAMGTSISGYIQRKIIKVSEDVQIRYDGTVRDNIGKIYQMIYNNDGFNPEKTVKVNGVHQPCNIFRIADKLNYEFEDP